MIRLARKITSQEFLKNQFKLKARSRLEIMILSIYYKNRTWTSTQKNITKVVLKALKTLIMTAHTLKTRDQNIDH